MRALLLLSALSISACGVRAPGGILIGTTGFLEEYNRGVHTETLNTHQVRENLVSADRARLTRLIESSTKEVE
jgi:hypothetical protein